MPTMDGNESFKGDGLCRSNWSLGRSDLRGHRWHWPEAGISGEHKLRRKHFAKWWKIWGYGGKYEVRMNDDEKNTVTNLNVSVLNGTCQNSVNKVWMARIDETVDGNGIERVWRRRRPADQRRNTAHTEELRGRLFIHYDDKELVENATSGTFARTVTGAWQIARWENVHFELQFLW